MFVKKSQDGYHCPVDGIFQKTLCHGKNTLMTEFVLNAGSTLPEHSHRHEQTGYLVSGHIILAIGDERFECRPGDSWCIPGDTVHSAEILVDAVAVEVFSPVREDYLP